MSLPLAASAGTSLSWVCVRLIGYSFLRQDAPAVAGYLPLDDVSVVIGGNDAGKTRLLDAFAAQLEGRPAASAAGESSAFFVALSDEEIASLPPTQSGDDNWKDSPLPAAPAVRKQVLSNKKLKAALAGSREVAVVEPLRPDEACLAFRCVRDDAVEDVPELKSRLQAMSHVDLRWLARQGAPIAQVAALGADAAPRAIQPIDPDFVPALPAAVVLPVTTDLLYEEAVRAMRSLVTAVETLDEILDDFSVDEADDDERSLVARELSDLLQKKEFEERLHEDRWLVIEPRRASARVAKPVLSAASALADAANALLPRFIGADYRVLVKARPPSFAEEWPISIRLQHTESETEFDMDEAADGFKLWLQLALFEGIDSLRLREARLWLMALRCGQLGADFDEAVEILRDAEGDDEIDEIDARDERDEATRRIDAALEELIEELVSAREGGVIERVRERNVVAPPRAVWRKAGSLQERVRHFRQRFYIIDEPERHLHPRLQREAARWLVDRMREHRSQCLVSTHSVPFMSLGSGTSYTMLRRTADGTASLSVLAPELLTALDEISADLGLNRGELLATRNLILFVEGGADQAVLEALFLKRLYEAGIAVVPLAGALYARAQYVDSHMLLRYTRAEVAFLLDELASDELQRLRTDETFLRESRRSGKVTLSQMAQIITTARSEGRSVEAFGIPAYDMFAMLDETILKREYPKFPGHAEAERDWEKSGTKNPRKKFYYETYDMPQGVDALYVPIADRMRESGRVPQALLDVMDDVERYALLNV